VFAPLLVLIFWMGVAPQSFLDRMQPALDRTLELTRQRAVSSASAAGVGLPEGTLSRALHLGPAFSVRTSPADSLGTYR
jgi:hypothetical protein